MMTAKAFCKNCGEPKSNQCRPEGCQGPYVCPGCNNALPGCAQEDSWEWIVDDYPPSAGDSFLGLCIILAPIAFVALLVAAIVKSC